jgi:hypothetical protein
MPGVSDKPPGKVGRPSLRKGEASVHVGIRLPQSEYDRVVAAVDATNARFKAMGQPPLATVSTHLRQVIADAHPPQGVTRDVGRTESVTHESVPPPTPSEPTPTNGHHTSDETTLRPALHGKRVKPRPEGVSPVVEAPKGSEGASTLEGPPDDSDLDVDAILSGSGGTPL